MAAVIVGLLVILSLILTAVTLFPNLDANRLTGVLFLLLVASLLVIGIVALAQRRRWGPDSELAALSHREKETWRMPPLEELTKSVRSATRNIGPLTPRLYLVIAVVLLVVKENIQKPSSPHLARAGYSAAAIFTLSACL